MLDNALAERRYQVKRQIKQLEIELAEIDQEIKDNALVGEVIYGKSGMGFKLTKYQKASFGAAALRLAMEYDLLPRFFSMSESGVKDLAKMKVITKEQQNKLLGSAIYQDVYRILEEADPAMKL